VSFVALCGQDFGVSILYSKKEMDPREVGVVKPERDEHWRTWWAVSASGDESNLTKEAMDYFGICPD